MTIDKKYYIITHQKMPWKLPFEHKLVGVEGFSPDLKEGISNEVISKLIDYETAFGSLRSLMAINNDIKDDPDSKVKIIKFNEFNDQSLIRKSTY